MSPGRSAMHCATDTASFAQRANVERDFTGALIALHSIVVQARQQHVAQADLQFRGIEVRMPRPHRIAGIVEYAHQIERQSTDVARTCIHVRSSHCAGGRELHIAEIGASPGRAGG